MSVVKDIDYRARLVDIKNRNVFTENCDFDVYIGEVCRRYAKVYGEILDRTDYGVLIEKLQSKGFEIN